MINPPPSFPPSQFPSSAAAPKKSVRPWVWALVSIGGLLILTLAAMLFLLYAVDWSKWENKLKGAAPFQAMDSWKDVQEAQKLKAKGRFNEALALYKQAIKKSPNMANAHKSLIRLAILNDSLGDLESFYSGLIRDNPQDKTLPYYLAEVYFAAGKYPEALNVFQNLNEAPKSKTSAGAKGASISSSHILLNQAIIYARMGKFTEAAEKCAAVKKTPEGWKSHYVLGDIYAYQGNYEKALEEYRRCLPSYTWDMNPYLRIGELSLARGNSREAEEAFLQVLEKNPYNTKVLLGLARLALKEEKYEKALNYLGGISQEETELSAYHNLYGRAYFGLGRYPLAQRYFIHALYYDPYDAESARGLGDSLAAQEKWEAAEKAYLKAVTLNPYQREAYLGLQKVYNQQGEPGKAKRAASTAARLPKAESLKWSGEAAVVARDLELLGIFGNN